MNLKKCLDFVDFFKSVLSRSCSHDVSSTRLNNNSNMDDDLLAKARLVRAKTLGDVDEERRRVSSSVSSTKRHRVDGGERRRSALNDAAPPSTSSSLHRHRRRQAQEPRVRSHIDLPAVGAAGERRRIGGGGRKPSSVDVEARQRRERREVVERLTAHAPTSAWRTLSTSSSNARAPTPTTVAERDARLAAQILGFDDADAAAADNDARNDDVSERIRALRFNDTVAERERIFAAMAREGAQLLEQQERAAGATASSDAPPSASSERLVRMRVKRLRRRSSFLACAQYSEFEVFGRKLLVPVATIAPQLSGAMRRLIDWGPHRCHVSALPSRSRSCALAGVEATTTDRSTTTTTTTSTNTTTTTTTAEDKAT